MPTQAALWSLSAGEIAAAVRRGDVSCREVTASVLDHIHDCNPRINALTEVLADEALAAADAADRARASGAALGPLHGVPVTIKINVDQVGHATSNGVIPLRDHIAHEDAPLVTQWRQAGAIIVGRSNTPAYSWRWFTDNGLHGRTLNPWDAAITPAAPAAVPRPPSPPAWARSRTATTSAVPSAIPPMPAAWSACAPPWAACRPTTPAPPPSAASRRS